MAASRYLVVAALLLACKARGAQGSSSSPAEPAASSDIAGPLIRKPWRTDQPAGKVTIGFLELPPSMVANTESIVLGMKAGFLACYRRGLASNPAMKGFVRIGVEIGRFGEVVQAEAKEGDGLSPELTSCLVRRVRSASFAPPDPEGSRASLRLSIGLQPTDE